MVNKEKLSSLSLKSKVIIVLSIIGIIILVLVICGTGISLYREYNSYKSLIKDTESIVKYDSKNVYYIDFKGVDSIDYDKYNEFLKELNDIEQISVSGTFDKINVRYKELRKDSKYKKIHKKIIEENIFTNMSNPEFTDIIRMSSGIYDMSDIDIELGQEYNEYSGEEIPVLVGYNYKDTVKIGQILTEEHEKNTYKVIGIMKKNSRWMENGNLTDVLSHITSYINLDNYFVAIYNYNNLKNNSMVQIGFDSTYICLKNKDDKEIIAKVKGLKEKYQFDYDVVNIKEIYERIEENTSFNMKDNISVGCIIFSVSMIGIILLVILIRKLMF